MRAYLFILFLLFTDTAFAAAAAVETVPPLTATQSYNPPAGAVSCKGSPNVFCIQPTGIDLTKGAVTCPAKPSNGTPYSVANAGAGEPSINFVGSLVTCVSTLTLSCPVGFQVSGTGCIPINNSACPSTTGIPYTFNTTTKQCDRVNSCFSKKGTIALSGLVDWGTDPNASPPSGFNFQCLSGCQALLDTGTSIQYTRKISGVPHYFGLLQQSFDGNSCTSSTGGGSVSTLPNLPPDSCATGQVPVTQIGGGIKCYADSGAGAGSGASGVPSTGTSASGVPSTGSTASSVPATGTSASSVPSAPATVSCDPATDPNKCLAPNPCLATPDLISCLKAEPVVNASDIATKDVAIDTSFASVTFASGGSCPAPKTLTLSKVSFSISYQPLCDFLAIFKLVILACSAFIGGLILTGQRAADSAG